MATTVLFKVTPTKLGSIILDATVSATYSAKVDITEHPVEKGAGKSDHLRPKPETLTIEGIISNTPIAAAERKKLGDSMPRGGVGRAEQAFEALRRLKNGGETVTVVCTLGTFEEMAIESLDVPKNASTGDALEFTCTFKQVETTELKTVTVTRTPRASGKVNKGRDTAKPAPVPVRKSVLKKLVYGENSNKGGLMGALGLGQ